MSLEQPAILAWSHRLLPKCMMQAMDIMQKQVRPCSSLVRTEGGRMRPVWGDATWDWMP